MSKFSVKKPLTIFMAAIIVIVLGVVAYTRMTPDLMPNIDLPYVVVMTTYPGATPEKVETVISKPLEQTMSTLDNIKNVQSVSSSNASTMILEFSDEVNMDAVTVDIIQKINLIEGYWDDTVGTPVILKLNPNMLPVAVAAVSREGMDKAELSDFVNDVLLNKLEGTTGVASVSTTGLLEKQVNVVLSQEKIDAVNQRVRAAVEKQLEAAMQTPELDPEMLAMMMTPDNALEYGYDVSSMTYEDAFANGINATGLTLQEAKDKGFLAIAEILQQAEDAKNQAIENADIAGVFTMDLVTNILQAQNFAMPEGYVERDGVSYLVSVGDELSSSEEMENLLLFDPGMEGVEPIYLRDVADVFLSDNSASIYAKINGENGIMLSFSKQSDYATAKTSDNIKARCSELEAEYPGLHFTSMMDQGDYIYMVIESILQNLLLGAAFAIIILFLFLRDLRPTFITLCSIPLSVIFAIVLMYFSGITLNIISMSGLAISVGMLVDNSVVVIENIYRLKYKGYSSIRAAVSGASQVAGAIAASTLTTICVFAPIIFVEGITRQLFVDLALTLAYTLLASLIVALTLVPAMASGMLKRVKQKKHRIFNFFLRVYKRMLMIALSVRLLVLILAAGLLAGSVYLTIQKGFSFMPEMSMPQLNVTVRLPEDATMEAAMEMSDTVSARIRTLDEVETVGAMIGNNSILGSMRGAADTTTVTMYVMLKEDAQRTSGQISKEITTLCEDLECEVDTAGSAMSSMSAMLGNGISINIYGDDLQMLQASAAVVAGILKDVEGVAEVSDGIEKTDPEIHFAVDKEKAMQEGLTVAQVYGEISKAMKTENKAASVTIDGNQYDIVVSADNVTQMTPEEIRSLAIKVTGQDGTEKEVQLDQIAEIIDGETLTSINRENQRRYITVTATLEDGYNVTLVTEEARKALEGFEKKGISIEFSGENETIMESMEQLVQMLLLGLLLVYMIMVAQFQSLKSPFIIMFTIPLAFTGGMMGLYIADMEISVIAMLGFIMLSGIIVNNGIVLVDYINQLRMEGWQKRAAIIEAGVTRMRPILMTSITTILGLTVMLLGIGSSNSGTEMMQPLAVVCIGGLIYATILTLFVVPVLYDLMNHGRMRKVSKEDLEIIDDTM